MHTHTVNSIISLAVYIIISLLYITILEPRGTVTSDTLV